MIQVTLDTNGIVDIEEERPAAGAVRALLTRHHAGEIALQVCAITASENLPGGGGEEDFQNFQVRLERAGLSDVTLLLPPLYWGVTFWDHSLWVDEQGDLLDRRIHAILFSNVEYDYAAFCAARELDADAVNMSRVWRNAKCDVLALWSHIHHGGGVFVTSDRNFHKQTKKPELLRLGAGAIVWAEDAEAAIAAIGEPAIPISH